jgi:hypothetical protein
MDKELESSLQQMMALFPAEMKASQEKMYAEMEARAEVRYERFLAHMDELTSHRKGTMTCQTETKSCSVEMEVTDLEATPDETEAAVKRQELLEEATNFDTLWSLEDRCEDRRLVLRRRRGAKKPPASE